MSSPTLHDTLTELNALSQFFVHAEADIRQGKNVDMSGIDARVSGVCQTVQQAIPEQQKLYLPELTILLNLLDSCETALRLMHPADQSPTAQSQ